MGLVTLAFLLTMRALGIWFSDVIVWPVVLLAAGAGLLWRHSLRPTPVQAPEQPPAPEEERRERTEVLSRNGVGATLVIAAGIVFLSATHALTAARDVILAVLVAAVVLGIIFAPWAMRLVRSLAAEREERIRSQARAEMGAHLHDSVLQTLALVQKRADDPRAVAALARTQERELRAWLAGREGGHDQPRRGAGGGGRRGRARATACRWRSSSSATGRSTGAARRSWPPRARRWSTRRSSAAARRSTSTPRHPTTRCRSSCATAARASIPPRVPEDRRGRARVDRRAHGAPRRARRDPLGARRAGPRSS